MNLFTGKYKALTLLERNDKPSDFLISLLCLWSYRLVVSLLTTSELGESKIHSHEVNINKADSVWR